MEREKNKCEFYCKHKLFLYNLDITGVIYIASLSMDELK